jgi:ATP-dependent helicase/DNAse subunit B
MTPQKPKVKLSASRLKTAKTCSWLYWAKYHLKLPDKTNDGAARGSICHLIFECLGNPRHKPKFKKIIKTKDAFSVPSVERLIHKHAIKLGVDDGENIQMVKDMTLAGLEHDFFGAKRGKPTQEHSEYEFDLHIKDEERDYCIKGFIDKLFLYKKNNSAIIRDFKTSKQVFKGEDETKNLQDYIYCLAIRQLFPEYKNRTSEFLFLKFDLQAKGTMKMKKLTASKLKKFEIELTKSQTYLEKFSERQAKGNYAADKPRPKDGSFGGQIVCGFAKFRGQLKKDGNPMWHCVYKFPFDYYALYDKKGRLIKTEFPENYYILTQMRGPNDTIKKMKYEGCPRWNYYS